MMCILRGLWYGRRERARLSALGRELKRIASLRDGRLQELDDKLANMPTVLGFEVPNGPAGGRVYNAQRLLFEHRSDKNWISTVQVAEVWIGSARGGNDISAIEERLAELTLMVSRVGDEVSAAVQMLNVVADAGAAVASSPLVLQRSPAESVANMVLFAPELAMEVVAGRAAAIAAHSDSTRHIAMLLGRRQRNMHLCGGLPHRRRVSSRVRARIESAAVDIDDASVDQLSMAHQAVSVAMSAIHVEQLGDARR